MAYGHQNFTIGQRLAAHTWLIYVVAVGSPSKIQVLQSSSGRPDGPYTDKGFVASDAIDPDVLLHHPDGKKHLVAKADRMTSTELDSPWSTTGVSLDSAPDPEPQTTPQEISTGPVTAVGFASINVEIRTELEKRVLYAL
jgi:hypothetical protein